jgi:hypothetical protein
MQGLLKIINQKDKLKCSLVFDEFPTLTTDIIPTISTGRSNLISTCLGIQDASQLRKDYGREQADVIMNITGNMAVGQVSGDTAKSVSEKIGRIMQDRESLSINRSDTSISRSKQLEAAVPPSRISALSSGEFVGNRVFTTVIERFFQAFNNEFRNGILQERKHPEMPDQPIAVGIRGFIK